MTVAALKSRVRRKTARAADNTTVPKASPVALAVDRGRAGALGGMGSRIISSTCRRVGRRPGFSFKISSISILYCSAISQSASPFCQADKHIESRRSIGAQTPVRARPKLLVNDICPTADQLEPCKQELKAEPARSRVPWWWAHLGRSCPC
eukprot:scaffold188_cov429-Prasinococcus_capsulatus_cf.AAC.18